ELIVVRQDTPHTKASTTLNKFFFFSSLVIPVWQLVSSLKMDEIQIESKPLLVDKDLQGLREAVQKLEIKANAA
ncbi:hypothetical protein DNTS_025418, partial [Danionella cerebrum]